MSIYDRHVFFCTNHREIGSACNHHGAMDLCAYAKKRLAVTAPEYAKRVRVNRAGCLARCQDGPVIVVYPEAVWYTYVDAVDIDEIVNEHLINGRFVDRLRFDTFPFQK